jgi:ferritin-like protein
LRSREDRQTKTIAQFVKDRITILSDLQDALETAMQFEFSTIPPYLCAQWSIDSDPSDVADMIEGIVVHEMYHFALAGNMLTAIGGVPNIANAAFIPSYPTNVLPGGIPQKLAVDLQPLTPKQAQVFMQIEYPEFPPVALAAAPATIGAFYDTIADGFTMVSPTDQSQRLRGQFWRSNLDQEHCRCARGDFVDQGRRRGNVRLSRPASNWQHDVCPLLCVQGDLHPENPGAERGGQLELYMCCDPVSDDVQFPAIDRDAKSFACVQSGRLAAPGRSSGLLDQRG